MWRMVTGRSTETIHAPVNEVQKGKRNAKQKRTTNRAEECTESQLYMELKPKKMGTATKNNGLSKILVEETEKIPLKSGEISVMSGKKITL